MKTTKQNFEVFKKEFSRLVSVWGLISWRIIVDHAKIDHGTLAETTPHMGSRIVWVELNKTWIDPITTDELKHIALHEALELLFTPLESMVCKKKKDQAREEVHALIQTIINVVNK